MSDGLTRKVNLWRPIEAAREQMVRDLHWERQRNRTLTWMLDCHHRREDELRRTIAEHEKVIQRLRPNLLTEKEAA